MRRLFHWKHGPHSKSRLFTVPYFPWDCRDKTRSILTISRKNRGLWIVYQRAMAKLIFSTNDFLYFQKMNNRLHETFKRKARKYSALFVLRVHKRTSEIWSSKTIFVAQNVTKSLSEISARSFIGLHVPVLFHQFRNKFNTLWLFLKLKLHLSFSFSWEEFNCGGIKLADIFMRELASSLCLV